MAIEYSVDIVRKLRERFSHQELIRPERVVRYEAGDTLEYDASTIEGDVEGRIGLEIEKFVGGGFAGQVYRVKVTAIDSPSGPIESLGAVQVGNVYAMKILIPPSGFSVLFRNLVYYLGFQAPFQLQVNPEAARAGALWQKFIRRAARIRFGDESCVNDIHVTFVDDTLGSCGELSDWVDGRTWRLEVDEHLDTLKQWAKGKPSDEAKLGSPEYRAKKQFMNDLVQMLHDMGAYEFARQYEWSTCKSQPNALKRTGTDQNPAAGLIAVDFRAGLALLPYLPMSPGDFKLIRDGFKRGSLVQFDRGDLDKLESFVTEHAQEFDDMRPLLDELRRCEEIYRDSQPDITHNFRRMLTRSRMWSRLFSSNITGWKIRGLIDEAFEEKLRGCWGRTLLFWLIGIIPFLGRFFRKFWGHARWRKHYGSMFGFEYFKRAVKGRIAERVLAWYRQGRVTEAQSQSVIFSFKAFVGHKLLSILPVGLHRFITDGQFRKDKLYFLFVRPYKLYFNHEMREQWMLDMVAEGQKKHILTDEDAAAIHAHMKEPYIQKYLISLVVHLLTLPVTQVVSVIVAAIFYVTHPDMDPTERKLAVAGILVLFQVIPISPGSFCRGLYTTILAIRERNYKDYNIALFLSYFKYVGYLAFPIQMTYHYPAISRFMAGHWATDAVHIVPVFGERGALLERWVFNLFYNWPLTICRRMAKRMEARKSMDPVTKHLGLLTAIAAAVMCGCHYAILKSDFTPAYENWWLAKKLWFAWMPTLGLMGAAMTARAGGMGMGRRIGSAVQAGIWAGLLYTIGAVVIEYHFDIEVIAIFFPAVWRCFFFALFATLGCLITELLWPDPDVIGCGSSHPPELGQEPC